MDGLALADLKGIVAPVNFTQPMAEKPYSYNYEPPPGVPARNTREETHPVKVLDAKGGGSLSNIVRGINWAANHGVDIINMSLGAPQTSPSLERAVARVQVQDQRLPVQDDVPVKRGSRTKGPLFGRRPRRGPGGMGRIFQSH